MGEDIAAANVNRSYLLGGTNIAIFTFILFFLYPKFESGRINPLLFQFTLIAMGVAAFSLVFAALHYYQSSLDGRISEADNPGPHSTASNLGRGSLPELLLLVGWVATFFSLTRPTRGHIVGLKMERILFQGILAGIIKCYQ